AMVALIVSSSAFAQDIARSWGFHTNVVITTHDNLILEFLNEAVSKVEDCNAAADLIANTVQASCPACTVTKQVCPRDLSPAQRKLLSGDPIEIPSSRLPNGVVAYLSDDPRRALAACQQTERLTESRPGFRATCFPPDTPRPVLRSEERRVGKEGGWGGSARQWQERRSGGATVGRC